MPALDSEILGMPPKKKKELYLSLPLPVYLLVVSSVALLLVCPLHNFL